MVRELRSLVSCGDVMQSGRGVRQIARDARLHPQITTPQP